MKLTDFYHYVFSDWAKIDVSKIPEDKQAAAKESKKKKIQDAFKFITDNSNLSKDFRGVLAELKANDLEKLLYGSLEEKQEASSEQRFPSDKNILDEFTKLDQQYKYFSQDPTIASKNYLTLFKACKLIADYVENNNTSNNEVAYQHAYKMLVLFGANEKNPLALTTKFIEQHGSQFKNPIHDILVNAIPENNPPVSLKSWQKLIQESGCKAILLFQQAPQIEAYLKKAPKNLKEGQQAVANIKFKRAAEYPELAELCIQYNVSEEIFNTCLSIKPKKSDQLPNISIDGSIINQPGYHLVKLPVDDPRAYLLGHITNCCQSIGGHSEQCVIDGITSEKNGFYVLLKKKSATEIKEEKEIQPLINGRINYNNYDLVGQGYAWLSRLDNLTFDSWENRTPDVDDAVIVPMLKEFAKVVTEKNKDIFRVTIGTGGKTPNEFSGPKLSLPEIIATGNQYGDSDEQVLLYSKPNYNTELEKSLEKQYGIPIELDIFSMKQVEWIRKIFLEDKSNDPENINIKKRLLPKINDPILLEGLFLLHQGNILKDDDKTLSLLKYKPIIDALSTLHKTDPKLISNDNFMMLYKTRNSDYFSKLLDMLYIVKPQLINNENLKLLFKKDLYWSEITTVLTKLTNTNTQLITNENLKLLVKHAEHCGNLARALDALANAKTELINAENCKLLVENAHSSREIAEKMLILYSADPKLINDDNRKLLAESAIHGYCVGIALARLYKCDRKLINGENFRLLAKNGNYSIDIADALVQLYKVDPKLIDNDNRRLLAECVSFRSNISNALITLYKADPKLINNESRKMLSDSGLNSSNIAGILATLYKANPQLINDETLKILSANIQNSDSLNYALPVLERVDPKLINDDNFKLLVENLTTINLLTHAFNKLYAKNRKLATDENFKRLAKGPESPDFIADKIIANKEMKQPQNSELQIHGLFKSKETQEAKQQTAINEQSTPNNSMDPPTQER